MQLPNRTEPKRYPPYAKQSNFQTSPGIATNTPANVAMHKMEKPIARTEAIPVPSFEKKVCRKILTLLFCTQVPPLFLTSNNKKMARSRGVDPHSYKGIIGFQDRSRGRSGLLRMMVFPVGFEPTSLSTPDPKSGASANSATGTKKNEADSAQRAPITQRLPRGSFFAFRFQKHPHDYESGKVRINKPVLCSEARRTRGRMAVLRAAVPRQRNLPNSPGCENGTSPSSRSGITALLICPYRRGAFPSAGFEPTSTGTLLHCRLSSI